MEYVLKLSAENDARDAQLQWLAKTYGQTLSPGGAVAYLGITRQAVHHAMRCDLVDVIRVVQHDGSHLATLLPLSSIIKYREAREASPIGRVLTVGRRATTKTVRLRATA